MVFFLTYKKKINPDMTCKAPPCAMNGRFLLEGDSDFSRSSIVLHRFLRPTRSRPLLSFRPRRARPLGTKESPRPASSPHSPASPRLPSSLKGCWPSPRTSMRRWKPKAMVWTERTAEADQRWAGDSGNTALEPRGTERPADAICERPNPAS